MLARLLVAAVLLAASAAAAQPVPSGGVPDLVGPRALALGAAVGIAAGNEGIFLNPAGISARKRYSVEGGVLVDRRGADTAGQFLVASVVDSMTAAVAGAVSYARAQEGDFTGSVWHLALSGPLLGQLHLGVAGKYLDLSGPLRTQAVTVDAGIFWQVAELVSLGAAGYNLVPISNEFAAPMGFGGGVALGTDRAFQVTADWRADLDRAGETRNRFAAGVELLLGERVPVRAGWMKDELLDTQWWSIGAGLVAPNGVALDVGYRQSLDDANARTIAATLKLFLFQ